MSSSAWVYVALGGAVGSLARYAALLFWQALQPARPLAWPLGTLAVNVAGSVAIGVLAVVLPPADAPGWRLFWMTGVLGGFTTMSTFALDTVSLLGQGRSLAAGGYVAASMLSCIAGCALGFAAGSALRSPL